ncbi:hypothetical protein [uncultured Thiodictyon sp.]|uniref:hypothetical protein n=1 Tax=uncultured Thiodictyon sp. TaxID=1846217 RepID=UPI0025E2A09D|nr:hypothetical protein [uncultured Thiodictyon sp.]
MRDFIRRFRRAVRTIPRRVRWILITPVAFIVLFLIDGKLASSAFFAVFAWLVVVQLYRDRHLIHGIDGHIHNGKINPATGLKMTGLFDKSGNLYGCNDDPMR